MSPGEGRAFLVVAHYCRLPARFTKALLLDTGDSRAAWLTGTIQRPSKERSLELKMNAMIESTKQPKPGP